MKTTYRLPIAGLDAEQLGAMLGFISDYNRKCFCGRVQLPEPEIALRTPDHNDVMLLDVGANKIQVIKAIREFTGLGLKESKDLVEAAPQKVASALSRASADRALNLLLNAGEIG